ncbi:MAG: hypothetical protein JXR14_03350 [Paracoccaceae bacterium]
MASAQYPVGAPSCTWAIPGCGAEGDPRQTEQHFALVRTGSALRSERIADAVATDFRYGMGREAREGVLTRGTREKDT